MLRRHLLYTVSLTALASTSAALAQQSLPTIDIGGARRGTAVGRAAGGGARSTGDAGGSGSGIGSGGGGRPVLTSQNSYVVPNASVGTKTNTPVMNTPLNVQVITQKVIDDQQDTTLRQALENVSGITTSYSPSGGNATGGIFMRGFLTREYYQDGVRYTGQASGGAEVDLLGTKQFANISSIEVLKGPAAILYGLSEPGGIINITTKNPEDTPRYAFQQQVSALALYRTRLAATGPVTADKSVLYRVDMSYESNGAPFGSFIDRTHSQNFFVAPVVKWQIDNDTWVRAEVNYSNTLSSLFYANEPMIRGLFVNRPRNTNFNGDGYFTQQNAFAALTGAHNFNEDWSLKSRVTFYNINNSAVVDSILGVPTAPIPTVTLLKSYGSSLTSAWQVNQDLVGHFDVLGARNTLLLGGDYARYTAASFTQAFVPWGGSQTLLFNPIYPGIPVRSLIPTQHTDAFNRQDTAGLYVQDQIELPYGVHVMAGARYQYIFQWATIAARSQSLVSGPQSNNGIPAHIARVTPRFGLLWRPEQWMSFYGNYAQGFGANTGTVYPNKLAPPTDVESWEAGAKFEFFDGRLRATVDYYNLIKTNLPIADPDQTHLCNGTPSCVLLIGKARSFGPEVDIQGELLPGWNVIVAYTNQDVRVVESSQTSGASANAGVGLTGLKAGERIPNVPRNLARLWTTYEFQNPSLKGLKVGGGYTYHGSQTLQNATFGRIENSVIPLLPSWGTVDLMAAYSFDLDGMKTTAQLNATNILNRTYYTAGIVAVPPSTFFLASAGTRPYGAPFNIVGSLKIEF